MKGRITMNFHSFGDSANPKMLLIHGVLCPWQIWNEAVEHYSDKYFVIVPELDGHTQDAPSEFISIQEEAAHIEEWLRTENITQLDVLCGLSMGGGVAAKLWENGNVKINHLVLDGAPLTKAGGMTTRFITGFYAGIVRKSKQRDPKTLENFKKVFLPAKHLDNYLRLVDNMSDSSIINVCHSILQNTFPKNVSAEGMRILYMYGTKSNESLSKKSAKLLKKRYKNIMLQSCKGMMHAELFCFHPMEWLNIVDDFLGQR